MAYGTPALADPYRAPLHAHADKLESLTFSRLVVRFPGDNEIGVEGGHLRVQFLEALRHHGYPALGAESLVFDEDKSNQARFVLGGTANELACRTLDAKRRRCELGVSWELLDRRDDRVVYRVETRHATTGTNPKLMADQLLWGAFYSLLARPKLMAALEKRPESTTARPSFATATMRRCVREAAPMPASAEAIMQATVVIQAGDALGSGSLVSPDGFILTAAHVVADADAVTFQQKGGPKVDATIVRVDETDDVALLKAKLGSDYPCIALRDAPIAVGNDVFAIGSPLGQELSFSLTRGVVSGLRKIDGKSFVQTDASINRGNSGGPLLDADARLMAVVSWKLAGSGVEGLAFGVPVTTAMNGLALTPGDASDPALDHSQAPKAVAKAPAVEDKADAVPALAPPPPPPVVDKPKGPKTRTARALSTAGWITAGAGAVGVGTTYVLYTQGKSSLTQAGFDRDRIANDMSWAAVVIGAGLVVTAELLPREPLKPHTSKPHVTAGVGPGSVAIRVTY